MRMYNPPHSGLIQAENFETEDAVQKAAAAIGLAYDAFNKILQGEVPIIPDLAYLLHERLHCMKPEIWIRLQAAYDAWQAGHNSE